MCEFLSAILTRKGDLLCEPMLDSHSDLIKLFRLHERDDAAGSAQNFIKLEYTPNNRKFFDFDAYTLRVDEDESPSWYSDKMKGKAIKQLRAMLDSMVVSDDSRKIIIGKALLFGDGGRAERLIGCRLVAATAKADLSSAYLSGAYLSSAYLSGADLSRADLSGANLSRADLSGANLSRADLSGANLSRADLSRANLSRAYLSGANLSRAYLSGANLSRAYLSSAYLSGADLSRADLSGANLSRADLSGANLSRAYRPEGQSGYKVSATGHLEKE